MSLVLTPRAQGDLDEIWDYTAANWGEQQAEDYTRMLQAAMLTLVAAQSIGHNTEGIADAYLKQRAGSHVIFFRRSGEVVIIVRVLHQQMDFPRHL